MRQIVRHALAMGGAALLFTACADQPVEPAEGEPQLSLIQPMCTIGCGETDPYPDMPGIFLGSGVTAFQCFEADHTDADFDGLSDFCEYQLAWAFRPELAYYQNDDMRMEPYWAAHGIGGDTVRIAYLLSYYVDAGTEHELCPLLQGLCDGHAGDSEYIALDVSYNTTWSHWIVRRALYSAHGDANVYESPRPYRYPQQLEYGEEEGGGYPVSYVAIGKHANYASESECDAGGTLGFDDCHPDRRMRIRGGQYYNIGSFDEPFHDCVESENPLYQGVLECYWDQTELDFTGWQDYQPSADPYYGFLEDLGFILN